MKICLLILFYLHLAPYTTAKNSETSGRLALQYDTGGQRVLACPPWALNVSEDCGIDTKYDRILLSRAMPNVVAGLVFLFIAGGYLFSRFVLNCCGGKNRIPNFCFPSVIFTTSRYSKGDLLRPLVLSGLVCLLSLVVLIQGGSSISEIKKNLNAMKESLKGTKHLVEELQLQLDTSLRSVEFYSSEEEKLISVSLLSPPLSEAGEQWVNGKAELYTMLNDMSERTVEKLIYYVGQTLWFGVLLFFVLFGILSFGCFLALCHIRKRYPLIVLYVLIGIGICAWMYLGVCAASYQFLRDSCREVRYFSSHQSNIIPALTQCSTSKQAEWISDVDGAAVLNRIHNAFTGLVDAFNNETCRALCESCKTVAITAPTGYATSEKKDGLTLLCNEWDSVVSNGLNQCAERCMETEFSYLLELAPEATETVSSSSSPVVLEFKSRVHTTNHLQSAWATHSALGSCEPILTIGVSPLVSPCVEVEEHYNTLLHRIGLSLLLIIAGMISMALGSKRFMPLDAAYAAIESDEA